MEKSQLSELVDSASPRSVMGEVEDIMTQISPAIDLSRFAVCFEDVLALFEGGYPGYRACNLEYHDLKHTTDTLLALARLIHGAVVEKKPMTLHNIELALITALLHDTGYIQTEDDDEGTGAKYTAVHIERSLDFMRKYYAANDFTQTDLKISEQILRCTGLTVKISEVKFHSGDVEMLGKMMGTADLLGQMGDRCYLEKLLFLYHEFREGKVGDYRNELDLLEKTVGFYEMTVKRLTKDLGGVDRLMRPHFRVRWNIDHNLYAEAIERQIEYLVKILDEDRDNYRSHLKRDGLVSKLERL
jgi:hypothetical protein